MLYDQTFSSNSFQALVLQDECYARLGGRNHPPVLTSGFNQFKPPRSICQKVVNTGQYESEWSIENSKERFCGELR